MKTIERVKNQSLYLKIFESREFDCTIFVYLDENHKVASFNFHWGTEDIRTEYMKFNENGEATQLYRMFLDISREKHSPKIYDMVIGAMSITHKDRLNQSKLEMDLAELKFKNKTLQTKIDNVLGLVEEMK